MSNILDFGPIYTSTGNIIQLDYATKCAEAGSTVIGLKSRKGLVIAVEKPKESRLVSVTENKRIKKLASGVYMAYTGLLSDGIIIADYVKYDVLDMMQDFQEKISPNYLKAIVSRNVSLFTTHFSYRPLGCHLLCALHHNGEYRLLATDCTSRTLFYKAYAIGKGAMRAKTELEKIDCDDLSVDEMADHAVRIMYKSYDPLRDKEFSIELGCMSEETNFMMQEIDDEKLASLVEKYQEYTVDGE